MNKFKVVRCPKCKKMMITMQDSACPTVCCGEAMQEVKANTTDGALEKHVPAVEVNGNTVNVTVGSVIHPMLEEHYIQWIALETENGYQLKYLNPKEEPEATFLTDEKPLRVYEYCNLHGLWVKEL